MAAVPPTTPDGGAIMTGDIIMQSEWMELRILWMIKLVQSVGAGIWCWGRPPDKPFMFLAGEREAPVFIGNVGTGTKGILLVCRRYRGEKKYECSDPC
ncbi:hypothetical protein DPEC_G00135050 [Dallia pectoralis]|uniref:Uncharacterized protein n=1 Tax=Dallia pectoralis TaxID=75939 RepID=A0ACC2GRZ2_DALPE|nr:hypothetical protein DPEC_G00135050 [Dallia pectoralis]